MRCLRRCMLVCAMLLPSTALTDDVNEDEGMRRMIEGMLKHNLVQAFQGYLQQEVLASEEMWKENDALLDRDFWLVIKDSLDARARETIANDEFIQAALPIIANLRAEMKELLQETLQRLMDEIDRMRRNEEVDGELRTVFMQINDQLEQKAAQIVASAVPKIKALAAEMPAESAALVDKVNKSIGVTVTTADQKATMLISAVLGGVKDFNFVPDFNF